MILACFRIFCRLNKLIFVTIMKKLNYLFALIVLFLSSCATYDYKTTSSDEAFTKVYCKNPDYLETKTFMLGDKTGNSKTLVFQDANGQKKEVVVDEKVTEKGLTISQLISYSQSKYGKDVTISNVRWDIETSTSFLIFTSVQKIGATFDVIRCK